jgi:hypothetical protein
MFTSCVILSILAELMSLIYLNKVFLLRQYKLSDFMSNSKEIKEINNSYPAVWHGILQLIYFVFSIVLLFCHFPLNIVGLIIVGLTIVQSIAGKTKVKWKFYTITIIDSLICIGALVFLLL